MIKLKIKEPEETIHQDKHLFNVSHWDLTDTKIYRLDIETIIEDVWDLTFPKGKWFYHSFIIQLPNNELLLCGGPSDNKTTACIIDCGTKKIRKFLNLYLNDNNQYPFDLHFVYIRGATYWNNSIYYIIGQIGDHYCPFLWNYNLLNNKKTILAAFPIKLKTYNSVCFEEKLVFGSSFFDIYVYDFYSNSYSKADVFCDDGVYVLISGKTNLYYISFIDIFESEYKNPYIWKMIGRANLKYTERVQSWTCYNNSIFIRESKWSLNNTDEKDDIYYEFKGLWVIFNYFFGSVKLSGASMNNNVYIGLIKFWKILVSGIWSLLFQ